MASLIFDSFTDDVSNGNIVGSTASFKAMLVTSSYTPSQGTHTKRSDVTNEVVGAGYSSGGSAVTCTVVKDTSNHRETWTFSSPSWTSSTITAHAAVIYVVVGSAATDRLVCYVDFGADVTSSGGTFSVTFSSPITFQQ